MGIVVGLVVLGLLAAGGLVYLRKRRKPRIFLPPEFYPTVQREAENPALLASLRQNLRLKVAYDEEKIDRLIDLERQRLPNASLRALMEAAIEKWERDSR